MPLKPPHDDNGLDIEGVCAKGDWEIAPMFYETSMHNR